MLKENFLKEMIAEDVGRGDLFARVSESKPIRAYIIAKSDGVFSGKAYVDVLAKMYDIAFEWKVEDGDTFKKGDKLVWISGDSRVILSLERSMLDIILHTSSIATLTAKYVDAIKETGVKLLDTRKTRPLLRELEKYAVRCGGGLNHRMGLDDCLMLKDTHLKIIENLSLFMQEVRKKIPFTANVEVECETFKMAQEAMAAGADIIMCDNMTLEETTEVVQYRNARHPHILIEASGNVTLDTIVDIAKTGVDAISSGSIIHQANWIDLSMRVEG